MKTLKEAQKETLLSEEEAEPLIQPTDNGNDEINKIGRRNKSVNNILGDDDIIEGSLPYHDSKTDVEIKLSFKRWLVLSVFCMISTANGAIWITLSSISNITMAYYRVSNSTVNWFSMSFLLGYAITALPASIFLSKFGLKKCILVAAALNGVGTCLRYAGSGRTKFLLVAVGQALAALGSGFILQIPPKLAAVWFGEKERATATSIGVLMNVFGVAIGFIQPTNMVEDSTNMKVVAKGMAALLFSQAVFCVVGFLMALLFIDEKPKSPPSRSEALRDEPTDQSKHLSLTKSMKILFKSKSFNLTSQALALAFGLLTVVSTLLNQAVKSKYAFLADSMIGLMGFVATVLGAFFTMIVGLLIDRYRKYKETAIALLLLSALSMAGFTFVLLKLQSFALLFTMLCLLNVGTVPFFSSGLEQIAEITYPIEEDISCVFALIFGNLYGFIFIYIFGWVLDIDLVLLAFLIITALFFVCLLFVMIAKVPMRRSSADHGRVLRES